MSNDHIFFSHEVSFFFFFLNAIHILKEQTWILTLKLIVVFLDF